MAAEHAAQWPGREAIFLLLLDRDKARRFMIAPLRRGVSIGTIA
jgi:hypothetical protein